jgi:uncharacterized protein DUF4238
MKDQIKKKHHYIPKFHLNKWKDEAGSLLVYRKDGNGNIESKSKHPSQVCFENDLYTLKKDLLESKNSMPDYIENELAKVDNDAAKVLEKILASSSLSILTTEEKQQWAIYVNSLLQRSPERLKASDEMIQSIITETLDDIKAIATKESSDTYEVCRRIFNASSFSENHVRVMLLSVIRHNETVTGLLKFKWQIIMLDKVFPYQFILTENPVVTVGKDENTSMLALALTPSLLWVALPDSFDNSEELNDLVKEVVLLYNAAQIAKKPGFIISKVRLSNDGLHNFDKIFSDFVKVTVGTKAIT